MKKFIVILEPAHEVHIIRAEDLEVAEGAAIDVSREQARLGNKYRYRIGEVRECQAQ